MRLRTQSILIQEKGLLSIAKSVRGGEIYKENVVIGNAYILESLGCQEHQ